MEFPEKNIATSLILLKTSKNKIFKKYLVKLKTTFGGKIIN
jgi:hypothetical protein